MQLLFNIILELLSGSAQSVYFVRRSEMYAMQGMHIPVVDAQLSIEIQ